MTTGTRQQPGLSVRGACWVALASIAAWIVHFTAAADQRDDDQLKPWGYAADIVFNGRWLSQTDYEGAFMSKPPLYQWLCALLAKAGLGLNEWSMYLPTGLAMLGSALLVWWMGARWFGARIGLAAGLAFVLSPMTIKHQCLARTDAWFCFTIALTALAAWRIWSDGGSKKSWLLFWLAAALATLTKGPLGIALGAAGLLAVLWERRTSGPTPRPERPSLRPWLWCLIGAGIWLAIVGGWFWLAVLDGGRGVFDRMIGRELIGHAFRHDVTDAGVFSGWYKPPLYFVSRYLPWGFITIFAMVGVVMHPESHQPARRAERFLFCWIAGGMLIFCASPHQRADLLLPLVPAAAVLAGRQIDRWLALLSERGTGWGRWPQRWFWPVAAAVMLAQGWAWNHLGRLRDTEVVQTQSAIRASEHLRAILAREPGRIEFAETAWDTQWLWDVKRPGLTPEESAAALNAPERVYILAREDAIEREQIESFFGPVLEVLREEGAAPDSTFVVYTNGK